MRKLVISGFVVLLVGSAALGNIVFTIPCTGTYTTIAPNRAADYTPGSPVVVAGYQDVVTAASPFRWTSDGGLTSLDKTLGGTAYARVQPIGISTNGSVVAASFIGTTTVAGYSLNGGTWAQYGSTSYASTNNISGDAVYAAGASPSGTGVRFDNITGSWTTTAVVVAGVARASPVDVNIQGISVGQTGNTLSWIHIPGANGTNNGYTYTSAGYVRADSVADGTRPRVAARYAASGTTAKQVGLYDYNAGSNSYTLTTAISPPTGYTAKTDAPMMSHDGLRVISTGWTATSGGTAMPFLWDNGTTMVWSDIATKWDLSLPTGAAVASFTSISGDGEVLTGTYTLSGATYGFAALLPEPASLVLLGLGGLFLRRRR